MQRSRLSWLLFTLLLIGSSSVHSDGVSEKENLSETKSEYRLAASSINSAGTVCTSSNFWMSNSLGQPLPCGLSSSENLVILAGFLPDQQSQYAGIDPTVPIPLANGLEQNYPNPFNPVTTILYSVAETSPVALAIYNVKGQQVRTLINERKSIGKYRVTWDGRSNNGARTASGVYFCRLTIGSQTIMKKMLLLK